MKWFFDSSILVPVFYADHPQHASSTELFLEAGKDDFCALRTLGEVYATLTGLPLRPRITGPEGISIVKQILERLTLITLGEEEYVSALEHHLAVLSVPPSMTYSLLSAPSKREPRFCSLGTSAILVGSDQPSHGS